MWGTAAAVVAPALAISLHDSLTDAALLGSRDGCKVLYATDMQKPSETALVPDDSRDDFIRDGTWAMPGRYAGLAPSRI